MAILVNARRGGVSPMRDETRLHDELWAGVDLKVQHAEFFLRQMSNALSPERRPMALAQKNVRRDC